MHEQQEELFFITLIQPSIQIWYILKKHRQDIFLARERALLPPTMSYDTAEKEKQSVISAI
jgi:hypothetical protein